MGARRMVRLVACLLMLLVVAGCDWLQSGYGAGHASYNPETALTPANVSGLTQKFTIATAGRSYKVPIVAGSALYATSLESATGTARLEAFDTTTGNQLFSTTLATGVSNVTPPVAANGVVYAVGGTTLFAVSASSGSILWNTPLSIPATGGSVGSSLTIDNGIVMVPLFLLNQFGGLPGSNVVLGVDATTGNVKWTWTADQLGNGPSGATPITQGLVAINYEVKPNPQLGLIPATSVIDESDGVTRWETNPNALTSDALPVAANGLFYGSVTDPQTFATETGAVDAATGSIVWSNALPAGSPAVSGRSAIWAYFLNDTAVLSAFDPHTGAGQWTSPPANGATGWSDPVIAGGVVLWVTTDGTTATLRANDAITGAQAAAITLPTSSAPRPIVANGQVYIADGTSITALALS